MTNASSTIPPGFEGVTPMLAVPDSAAAIKFYKKAFGAVEVTRLTDPAGRIAHAEIKIGAAIVMLADENPKYNKTPATLGGTAVFLHIYVTDVDALAPKAIAAGAKMIFPINDQFYGDRCCRLADPFGHIWIISTHKEDVSPEEMQTRFEKMCGAQPPVDKRGPVRETPQQPGVSRQD